MAAPSLPPLGLWAGLVDPPPGLDDAAAEPWYSRCQRQVDLCTAEAMPAAVVLPDRDRMDLLSGLDVIRRQAIDIRKVTSEYLFIEETCGGSRSVW